VSGQPDKTAEDAASLYRETILRHSRQPVGFKKTIASTHGNEQFNPLCGDRIHLELALNDGTVVDAAFDGESCAICKASASMLCEMAPGETVQTLLDQHRRLASALADESGPLDEEPLRALLGVRAYPSRIQCALLPWEALKNAL